MITDKQVRLVANILLNAPFGHNPPDDWVTDTRKALEAYEASKWVKLSDNAETPQQQFVIARFNDGYVREDMLTYKGVWTVTQLDKEDATHWQPLPEFKE